MNFRTNKNRFRSWLEKQLSNPGETNDERALKKRFWNAVTPGILKVCIAGTILWILGFPTIASAMWLFSGFEFLIIVFFMFFPKHVIFFSTINCYFFMFLSFAGVLYFGGILYSAGIVLIPGILKSTNLNLAQQQTKEEIYKQLDDLVYKNFPVYGTCSQTTFSTLNQVFNLDTDNIIKALASFPGIAKQGETCGAVSGCLLGIALVYEKDSDSKERPKLSAGPSINFCTRFESEIGSTRCRDVIQKVTKKEYQITKPQDYGILLQEGALNNCPEVVVKAVHIAADIILEKA